jgi:poly-gamma-glutamate synthesis protein (capsule biosynthesis protein)
MEPRVFSRTPVGNDVTVIMGGDFAPTDAAMPTIRKNGYGYPYARTADLMREADVAFANLEAPVTASTEPFLLWRKYIYRVEPVATETWKGFGLDLVSLANNHVVDYREVGLLDTIEHLEAASIAQVGAGEDESAARRPVIFDVGGTRVGFLAYLWDQLRFNYYLDIYAIGDQVGCAQLNRSDVEEDVRRLRPLVDILVVSLHWGENYEPITPVQEELGRWMVDELDVDVIVGHGAHDIQGVEVRDGAVIFYSLGNYAWGTPGHAYFRIGFLARLRIAPRDGARPARLAGVEMIPIATQNRIVKFQPRPITVRELGWLDPFLAATRALTRT